MGLSEIKDQTLLKHLILRSHKINKQQTQHTMIKKTLANSQLIDILRTLPVEELNQLQLFLQSKIFCNNKPALALFENIRGRNKKERPDYEKLDKKKLFFKIYPKRKQYKEGTLKNVVSDLKKLVEQYLAFSEYQKKTHLHEQFHLEALLRFRTHTPFQKKKEELLEQFAEQVKDPKTLLAEFYAKRTVHHYTTIHAPRNGNTSLQQMSEALDRFYISTKLKYLLGKLTWEHITARTWEMWLEPALLEFIETHSFEGTPIIQLYYQLVQLINKNGNQEAIETTKNYLMKHEQSFSDDENRQAYVVLLNYIRWEIKAGKTEYVPFAMEIYEHILATKILIVGKYLSQHHFRVIVEYAVQWDKEPFFWIERFIRAYENKIDERYREQVMPYPRAMLSFARKEFDKVLSYLTNIYLDEEGFFDFYYNLCYRVIRIQVYYELSKEQELIGEIERFRQYLIYHKNHISDFEIEANRNFLKIVEKLTRRQNNQFITKKDKLLSELKAIHPIIDKKWLLEKIH